MLLALASPGMITNSNNSLGPITSTSRFQPDRRLSTMDPVVVASEADGWKPPTTVTANPPSLPQSPTAPRVMIDPRLGPELPVYQKPWFWGVAGVVAGVLITAVVAR